MASRRNAFSMDHPIILTFLIIAIVASMSLAAEVLKPLSLAILLSFALAPIARRLERLGLPRAPAVILTVVTVLAGLGGVGFVVGRQLTQLANELPEDEKNIINKVSFLQPKEEGALEKASKVATDVGKTLEKPQRQDVMDVRVIEQPTFRERLQTAVGPYVETLGVGTFVLILTLFMLMNQEDLGDRIVQLFGHRRITLTTRTMGEVGQRISRYLAMFATVNSCYGLVVGLGLWAIGVPYAVLWGFLAGALRFIPYIGPATAILLPFLYSVAHFDAWRQPLMVIGMFGLLEVIANTFLEPVIYGRTTGISALSLMVAAMFWTWLWGALGLLLSTPMTVCLAVLGKYVPSLGFFSTLLGEEAELDRDVRYYQRLLALDQDGASEVVEDALRQMTKAEAFDTVLIPALSRAERDFAREELDEREQAFIWRVTGDILDEQESTPEAVAAPVLPRTDGVGGVAEPPTGIKLLGVSANDQSDALALRMLGQVLAPSGLTLELVAEDEFSPMKLAAAVEEHAPDLVVLSHLPPSGLTTARYLTRRLRARFPDLTLVVGRWGDAGDAAAAAEKLEAVGASDVVFSLAGARDRIAALAASKAPSTAPVATPAGAATA